MNIPVAEVWSYEDVETLRRQFSRLGLDPLHVLRAESESPGYERRLRALLLWVEARRRLGSREAMVRHRWLFPPVDSTGDVDEDWDRFETWFRTAQSPRDSTDGLALCEGATNRGERELSISRARELGVGDAWGPIRRRNSDG